MQIEDFEDGGCDVKERWKWLVMEVVMLKLNDTTKSVKG